MGFPYGTAPLAILTIAVLSAAGIAISGRSQPQRRPDLVFATFTKEHAAAYAPAIEAFERENHVDVQVQVVDQRALQSRLQSSMQAGADVPDMVELLDGTMGVFTKGPVEDVQFVDLTDRVRSEGLFDRVVTSRFGKWTSRGHVFALPHDVHPVMLAYRRDLIESMGIDVTKIKTWDDFTRIGRDITRDLDGDGVPDRYMLDLPVNAGDYLRLLLLQRGGAMFTEDGAVAFDSDAGAEVIAWYLRQVAGAERISFPAGSGQNFAKAMSDGLVLFYFCPDWRLKQFENDVPNLAGKIALMPLPAWSTGGRRTTTWGGTGLAVTRQCKQPDLVWKLAMHLYYDRNQLGERYAQTLILPPLKEAWQEPQFDLPVRYFSGQRVGRLYADFAPDVPAEQSSAYMTVAVTKLSEAYSETLSHYQTHGEDGLTDAARAQLKRAADAVRVVIRRNRFQGPAAAAVTGEAR